MANPVGCSPAALAAQYATDGLLVADWEKILYVNPALARLLGVGEADLIGQPIERFGEFVTEPDTVDRLRNAFRQGQPFLGMVTCHPRTGGSIPLELEVTPVPADPSTASPTPWMVSLSARDRTEANRLEHQLRQSQRLDAVTNLADGVAHEINNVVQILTGYGNLVLETLSSDDPRAADLQAIQQAANRGGILLKELLAFARRRPPAPRGPVDLNEVILGWKDLIQVLVGSDLRLILDLKDGLPPIKADRFEIQHILLNLVSNARDAMAPGDTLTISTHRVVPDRVLARSAVDERVGDYVVLTVADTGTGMEPETKARLFQPFFTTKDDRAGRGLGLATVQQIVRESGGLVWIRSRPGGGTSVEVQFPALRVVTSEPAAQAETPPEAPGGTETVLVVDDDPLVLRVATRALERLGYRVFAAGSAAQATAMAAERGRELDLLLTDIMMPGQRGTGLADELRADWPRLKVLFMTGYPLESETLGSGGPRLAKPFSPEQLAQAVRVALGAETGTVPEL